jgi:hypothetical protein
MPLRAGEGEMLATVSVPILSADEPRLPHASLLMDQSERGGEQWRGGQ